MIIQIPDCLIDLHLHLDGSLSADTMRELAAMQQIKLSEEEIAAAGVSTGCRDLNEYLQKFELPCALLQTQEALELASYMLFKELKEEGYLYAEVRFAPQLHLQRGLSQEKAVEAVVYGMHKAFLDYDMDGSVICCCMRGADNEKANLETIETAAAFVKEGVVAVDLAGAEGLYPTEDYADLFAKAQEEGLKFTIHAGEAAGAKSVACALKFGASRIGHGVRSVEDPEVLEDLVIREIPLELCPTSNLQTGIFAAYEEFPLRQLMKAQVKLTVNTDNRTVSRTNLRREYEILAETFALTEEELHALMRNSAESVFAPESIREMLCAKVDCMFRQRAGRKAADGSEY